MRGGKHKPVEEPDVKLLEARGGSLKTSEVRKWVS